MRTVATALWRRLDTPGHDACCLSATDDGGWRLSGNAVFAHPGGPASITYAVTCDFNWRAVSGAVDGWIGGAPLHRRMARNSAGWWLDDLPVGGLEDVVDLDFGFTPATNLLQLRRLDLPLGGRAEFDVAWLDVDSLGLVRLPQHYTRRSDGDYAYRAPADGYAATLLVDADGFVRTYPGLWRREVI